MSGIGKGGWLFLALWIAPVWIISVYASEGVTIAFAVAWGFGAFTVFGQMDKWYRAHRQRMDELSGQ